MLKYILVNGKKLKGIIVLFLFIMVLSIGIYFLIKLDFFNRILVKMYSGERGRQQELLLKAFLEKSFLGHGMGSYLKNFIRSDTAPWSYEYVY